MDHDAYSHASGVTQPETEPLGHESTETTHIYLEADRITTAHVLQKLTPAGVGVPRFRAKDDVLSFLTTQRLCAAEHDENHITRSFVVLTSHNPELRIIAVMRCSA